MSGLGGAWHRRCFEIFRHKCAAASKRGLWQKAATYMIWSGTEVANLDTTATISDLTASQRYYQFIPVRKEDLFSALIKQGELADPPERELFWRFARRCARSVTTNIPRRSIGCAMIITILVLRSQATPWLTA